MPARRFSLLGPGSVHSLGCCRRAIGWLWILTSHAPSTRTIPDWRDRQPEKRSIHDRTLDPPPEIIGYCTRADILCSSVSRSPRQGPPFLSPLTRRFQLTSRG